MTDLRTAAQQALEALEDMLGWQSLAPQTIQESAKGRAAALRAALAEETLQRLPLSEEDINRIDNSTHFHEASDWSLRFARAIERAHGIKE